MRSLWRRPLAHLTIAILALIPALSPVGPFGASASAAIVSAIDEEGKVSCTQTVGNATGVTVTRSGSDCIIAFTRVGETNWTVPPGITSVRVLVVAGGGGGGSDNAGGGGGGGVRYETVSVSATPNLNVVVGGGGAASGTNNLNNQTNGGNSSFGALTALGGGQGGNGQPGARAATSGGSGGGGHGEKFPSSSSAPDDEGALGEVGQGNRGGNGNRSTVTNGHGDGGGGGGAWEAGKDASSGNPGNGGDGRSVEITGAPLLYGSGGGGGTHRATGTARSGAGGTRSGGGAGGGSGNADAGAGENGFGGGGGGSGTTFQSGGNGGSGVVIVRYSLQPQTITFTDPGNRTYSPTAFTVAGSSTSRLAVSFESQTTAVCSVAGSSVTMLRDGTCTLRAFRAEDSTWFAAEAIRSFVVSKASQSITFDTLSARTFSPNTFSLSATATSGLAVVFTSTTTGICTVSGTTVTMVKSGDCTISASQGGNTTQYNAAAPVARSFSISKANQSITFVDPGPKTFGVSPFGLTVSTDAAGLTPTVTASPAGVCTVSGTEVTVVGAGDCTLVATQGGDDRFNAATAQTRTFTVAKADQSGVSLSSASSVPFGQSSTLTASGGSGTGAYSYTKLSGECTVTGATLAPTDVGSCVVRVTRAADANYNEQTLDITITITNGDQSISFTNPGEKTFGVGPFGLTVSTDVAGLTPTVTSSTTAVCTVSGTTVTVLKSGTCTLVANQEGNSRYNAATAVTQSFTVTKASQTITFANPGAKTFGAAAFSVSPSTDASGLAPTVESSTTDVCTISSGTVTIVAAGQCTLVATQPGDDRYLAATQSVSFTVSTASQTVTFAPITDKTYGDASFLATVSASSSLGVTLTSSTTSVCTVSTHTVTIVSAGTCTLVASQAGSLGYSAAVSVTRTFTVAPKAITMTVVVADKNYDGTSAATVSGTPSLTGLVSGDESYVAVNTSKITAAFATPDAGVGKSVSVTLGSGVLITGVGGDRSGSYSVTLAGTPTATINKTSQASLSFTSANTMVFGQSLPLVATGGSGSGALSYTKVSGPCAVSGSTVTSTGVGSCVVTATRDADTNYNSVTSSNFTITVSNAAQAINFTSTVPVSAVSGTTYTPVAAASSGLAVSFAITSGDPAVCSVSSGVVTFVASGTCVITATQGGDSNYTAAPSVTQTIVAGKINQTITFPAISGKDFDAPAFSAGASVSSGRTVTYATSTSSVCAVTSSTGVISIKTIGDCTVTASSAGDASFAAASDVSRTFTISPVVAGKPSITSVSFGDSSVTVAFGAPGFVGGDAIDGYQVVATSSGGSVTKPDCATSSPCTITGLTNGTSYTLTVAAINAAGVGFASDASPAITPARIPDAVAALRTTPGDRQLLVEWTGLTNGQLGGGTFTQYDVYLTVNGQAWGSPVTPDGTNNLRTQGTGSHTFTGLTNGTAYDVKVVAITSVNATALSSNTSTALGVPVTVPNVPTNLSVVAQSNTTALASWATPLDDGGDAVTAYEVNLSCTFVNPTDTFCELGGLSAGSRVTVTVGATNLMGTGSTISVSITMPGGSSGGSGSLGDGVSSTGSTPSTPVVVPRRVVPPLQPLSPPQAFGAPVVILPERGFDPDAGSKARIGGAPATLTKKPLDNGGMSLEAGPFQVSVTLSSPPPQLSRPSSDAQDLQVGTGQSTNVAGGGLLPGSGLQVWLPGRTGADARELARIRVLGDGTFDSELSFTADRSEIPIPIGRQVLQFTGYDEDGNQTVVDMTINIAQGSPQPEPNRAVGALPDLSRGQSLATSAGVPEAVTIEVQPEQRSVAVLSGQWEFSVEVPEGSGDVDEAESGGSITLVQSTVARVSGDGFQPDTRVDIWLFSDPTLLGSVIVAADGSFTGEVYLDARFAVPGEHTLQLQGVAEDGFIKAANLGVEVREPVELTTQSASGLLWWVVGAFMLALMLTVVLLLARRLRSA